MTIPENAPENETWQPWYRVDAGPDGLLIVGQDDESFGLDDEDGVEFLCHEMNRLWNVDHNRAKATGDLVKALETRCSYCAEGHEPVRTPEYDLVWVHARPGGWEMCGLDADIRQALAAFKESQHDHGK